MRGALAPLLLVTLVGAALRIAPVTANGFPLNDGGLFLAMINTIIGTGAPIPDSVAYNGSSLPFAYPPLGLYVASVFMTLTGFSGTTTLQIIPVALSVATIPVAYLLFKRLFDTEFRAIVATAAFAVIPRSYEWMINGGGVTRSLGLLAALATVTVAIDLYRLGGRGRMAMAGVLLGITGLAHPQAAVFAGTSLAVLLPFYAANLRVGSARLVGSVVVAGLILAPWLLTVVARHGLSTLLGAAETGGSIADSLTVIAGLRISDGLFEVLGIVGAFGLFVALVNRRWLLPTWLLVTILVSSRAGLTYASTMLAGGVAYGVADSLRLLGSPEPKTVRELGSYATAVVLVGVLSIAAVADSAASGIRPLSPLHGMDAGTGAALRWIKDETEPGSVILVASGTGWNIDATSEWLPELAGRRSSATVQGTEWLGPGVFRQRERQYIWFQTCAAEARSDCVQQWEDVIEHVDYVLAQRSWVAPAFGKDCCLAFAEKLKEQGATEVFGNDSAVILDTSGLVVARAGVPS